MKSKLFFAALLANTIASAATPVDGWYASVFGGYNYLLDNVSYTNPLGLFFNRTSYNDGYNVGGRVGYQNNPVRYELEYTYLTASNNGFNVNTIPQTAGLTGNSSGNILMANLYYDLPDLLPAISPFASVGIGVAALQTTLSSTAPMGGAYLSLSTNTFAYQAKVGLTYNFAENYALNIDYRYFASSKGGIFGRVFQANLAEIGAVYRFDEATYK